MAYESRDVQAHNEAQKAGIRTKGIDIVDPSHVLSTLICPRTPDSDDPAKLLAQAIEASDRFTANTTVCLEVEGTLPVPSYVKDALDNLNGYPVKLIVVCDGATTHAPGPLLDPELCQKVRDTSPGGSLWHPIAKQPVWS
jgi:hypothetical protein